MVLENARYAKENERSRMRKHTKHWITFYAPGLFVGKGWEKKCKKNIRPQDVEWPNNAYAFTLHKRIDVIEGTDRFKGEPSQIGPTYYHPDSRIETLDEVKRNPNATKILISNMESLHWSHIIWLRGGEDRPQPFNNKEDEVLNKTNGKKEAPK